MQNGHCPICGIPADAEFFDDAHIISPLPERGQQVVLASFQLPRQYCGILENFAQFTDLQAVQNEQIHTPGLEWMILRNGQPLSPYIKFEILINPWGIGCYPIAVRLDENAKIELIVRNRGYNDQGGLFPINKVGGRISGRYWYNRVYGGNGVAAGCETFQPMVGALPQW
ncbi:MAG: hypothetical protein ONB46_10620 [candidate division KSB1 bacterium]|nr:hypothetical protein [candidate division KSB1 bacterium]MDZ7366258.1 hypothetical protein [candidate division KSB1 bacterium]MDZ7404476.1 hypothetical protein [candidate division KSB1 bacterium]